MALRVRTGIAPLAARVLATEVAGEKRVCNPAARRVNGTEQ
jgi:hypothetical protein